MRHITKIIVHCTASDNPKHDNVETIREWHVKGNGWKDIGYHFLITKDGNVHKCRDVNEIGAHCSGENIDSIGVCLTGEHKFSPDQYFSLAWLISSILEDNPTINQVKPHNFYTKKKSCPNFDLRIFHTGSSLT